MSVIDNLSSRVLTTTLTQNLETPYFRVENFGFMVLTVSEQYPETWYPTPKDIYPGGWLDLQVDGAISGDFNGDGLEDLMVHPQLFPHFMLRTTTIDPVFLLQNPDGSFQDPTTVIENAGFPNKHMLYRLGVGDFNGDGVDDVSMSTMYRPLSLRTGGSDGIFISELPLTVYGSLSNHLTWTDTYKNLVPALTKEGWQPGYGSGHSMAVGDFNGDGLSDWFSDYFVAYSNGTSFITERISANTSAVLKTGGWANELAWPNVNACASADFNEDGFSDLAYSGMPAADDGTYNGNDLYIVLGSSHGLKDGKDVIEVQRLKNTDQNIGTNFMVAADFNGDGHQDLVLIEHGWVSDSGDSSKYYSEAKFRMFIGDGTGHLREDSNSIFDPYSGHRSGEGNLFATDVNGDGWVDLVSVGYAHKPGDTWTSGEYIDATAIFLNDHGVLNYLPSSNIAYVSACQFAGEEQHQGFLENGTLTMYPVDMGNDGLMDFVGFVPTPLHQLPQVEQQYTYAYISRAITPLGRIAGNETLVGTLSADKIYGYEGDDVLNGKAGNDTMNGGSGLDTEIFSGRFKEYSINAHTGVVTDVLANRDGTDTLINIERLQFSDTMVGLDVGAGQNTGEVYRLYLTVLGRNPQADAVGCGFWIDKLDKSILTPEQMVGNFLNSTEFVSRFGATTSSNESFVNLMYQNLLGRDGHPDSGFSFWLNVLNNNQASREQVVVGFMESPENVANAAPLIGDTPTYQQWVG